MVDTTFHIATHKTATGNYRVKAYALHRNVNGVPVGRQEIMTKNYNTGRNEAIKKIKQEAGLTGVKTDIYAY